MNINPICGVKTTPFVKSTTMNNKSSPAFKADYTVALNEGKNLIKKDSTISGLKRALAYVKNKLGFSNEIPKVEVALLAYFQGLQTKEQFLKEYIEKVAKGEYIDSNTEKIANLVLNMDRSGVTKSWEYPDYKVMFNNGNLTQTAYEELRNSIQNADYYKLNDYNKLQTLNELARSSYHTNDVSYDINFTGKLEPDVIQPKVVETPEIPPIVEDDDGSFLDAILEFLDDLF